MTNASVITPAAPSGAAAEVGCHADAACGKPAEHVLMALPGNGVQALPVCGGHLVAGRKIVSRETTAIIYTLHLKEA